MKFLTAIIEYRNSWLLLAISALFLELSALYFQYGMDLKPCIMCVYQRLAIIGLIASGLIGYWGHHSSIARFVAFALWATSAIWGCLIALEHVDMQTSNSLFFVCEMEPNFPTWLALHQWLPMLFEATGDCGEIAWQFVGFSMPQWMTVIFGFYSVLWLIIFASQLLIKRKI